MKKVLIVLLSVVLVFTMVACSPSATPTQGADTPQKLDPIKIGAALSQTGTLAHGGVNAQRAIEMLFEEVNSNGGVKGRQLEILIENTNTEPERAVSGALKLSNENKVLAILGPDNTSTATAVKEQVAEIDEVVAISVTGSSPKLTKDGPKWYFRGATPATYQTSSLVEYMVKELGFTKFAVMADSSLMDQCDSFVADLEKFNLKPVAIENHKSGQTNFNGPLLSIKQQSPEAIFFIGYVTEGVSCVKQARDMGVNAQFAGSIGIVYEEFAKIGEAAVEGVIGTIGFTTYNEDPKVQDFVKKFTEKYGEKPDHTAAQAYDQASLIIEAIKNKDLSFDPKDLASDRKLIRDYLENDAAGYQGLAGVICYTPEDHTAYKKVNVMVVKNGSWSVLKAAK